MIVDRLENLAARLGESGEGGWYRERRGENCWGNSLHPSLFPSAIKTHRCALQNITNITFSSTNSVCIQSLTSVEALQKISMKIRGNVVILTRPSHITTQNMLQFLLWIIKDKKSKWSWYRTTHRLIWGGIDLKFNSTNMSAHSELFNLGGRTNLPRLPNFTQLVTLSSLIVLTLLPHTAQGKTHKKEIKTAQNVHLNVLDMAVYIYACSKVSFVWSGTRVFWACHFKWHVCTKSFILAKRMTAFGRKPNSAGVCIEGKKVK